MSARTAYFISDGTGITAEAFGNAILAQFDVSFSSIRLPFIDSIDKAHQAIHKINSRYELDKKKPIVFTTLVNPDIQILLHRTCKGMIMDMFSTFLHPLEEELGAKSLHRVGRFVDISQSQAYSDRMEAINYTLLHDDGQTNRDLKSADVILIGVSRSGKTPTSLYLAMQHGMKVANYPLIPEDFERKRLPPALDEHRKKLFGLTILPERLSAIRNERRPGSKYAELTNCRYEVAEAEAMMRRAGVTWLSTTTKSIEEISTTILADLRPQSLSTFPVIR